jgi:glycerophosphoryl diester phosphodiesterase
VPSPRAESSADVAAVIGHRGAAGHAPENTLASLARAAELGCTWVEFDVMLTADGVPVLFHDDTLDRTTDGHGKMAATRAADLAALDAGRWFGPTFAGERVPTLTQALAALDRLRLAANVEIKPSKGRTEETAEAVCATLAGDWPASLPALVISSFQERAVEIARDTVPQYRRGYLMHEVHPDWRQRAADLGCTAIHANEELVDARFADIVLDAGFALRCYTVNKAARAEALYRLGATALFTDHPDRLLPIAPGRR